MLDDRMEVYARPASPAAKVSYARARLAMAAEPPAEYVYPADGTMPYLLAEGNMYGEAIMQAILDAGAILPRDIYGKDKPHGQMYEEMRDAIAFLYDPADRRRYYLAAAAGIDAETIDRILQRLLVGEVRPYGKARHLSADGVQRLRDRVSRFVSPGQPGLL